MKKLIFTMLVFLLLSAACGGSEEARPILAEENQPTLVYIYTDG